MQLLRSAIRAYPALWPAHLDAARALSSIERLPVESIELGDPPAQGRAHWEAVWRAAGETRFDAPSPDDSAWEASKRELTALATTLGPLPVPASVDAHRLIALLPPPADLGPAWVAIYLHERHHQLAHDPSAWNHPGVRIERVPLPPSTRPAIFHFAAHALVPVELVPFVDIHPHFFVESVWTDEHDEMHEWHEAEGFAAMPTTPEPYILAQLHGQQTKIGGFPVFNADEQDAPLWGDGEPMRYAFHLAAEFFDVEFGDAGSLHVWLSPSTTEYAAITDSA